MKRVVLEKGKRTHFHHLGDGQSSEYYWKSWRAVRGTVDSASVVINGVPLAPPPPFFARLQTGSHCP